MCFNFWAFLRTTTLAKTKVRRRVSSDRKLKKKPIKIHNIGFDKKLPSRYISLNNYSAQVN